MWLRYHYTRVSACTQNHFCAHARKNIAMNHQFTKHMSHSNLIIISTSCDIDHIQVHSISVFLCLWLATPTFLVLNFITWIFPFILICSLTYLYSFHSDHILCEGKIILHIKALIYQIFIGAVKRYGCFFFLGRNWISCVLHHQPKIETRKDCPRSFENSSTSFLNYDK